jgi:hypothetical protein
MTGHDLLRSLTIPTTDGRARGRRSSRRSGPGGAENAYAGTGRLARHAGAGSKATEQLTA